LIRNEKETITQPNVFLDAVFQRLIFERNTKQKLVYSQVMIWTFSKMSQEIGVFSEMSRLCTLCKQCFDELNLNSEEDKELLDTFFFLFCETFKVKQNVRSFLNCSAMPLLLRRLLLVHTVPLKGNKLNQQTKQNN